MPGKRHQQVHNTVQQAIHNEDQQYNCTATAMLAKVLDDSDS